MQYNQIYNNKNVWGIKPNWLLHKIQDQIQKGSYFLDFGCGQGRDSLFMLQKGSYVDAVDISSKGITDLEEIANKNYLDLENLHSFCVDMKDFAIAPDKYDVVNLFNSLQFLLKKDALIILNNLKQNLKKGAYIIVSGFTINDPSYKKSINKDKCFFESGELKNIFSDFEIIEYNEALLEDNGHPGSPLPHLHGVVSLLARK